MKKWMNDELQTRVTEILCFAVDIKCSKYKRWQFLSLLRKLSWFRHRFIVLKWRERILVEIKWKPQLKSNSSVLICSRRMGRDNWNWKQARMFKMSLCIVAWPYIINLDVCKPRKMGKELPINFLGAARHNILLTSSMRQVIFLNIDGLKNKSITLALYAQIKEITLLLFFILMQHIIVLSKNFLIHYFDHKLLLLLST